LYGDVIGLASRRLQLGGGNDSRQLDIHASGRVLSVVEVGVVVQLETGLHAVVVVKLDEGKAAAFGGVFFLRGDADCGRRVLLEVLGQGLVVGGVGKVACICEYIWLDTVSPGSEKLIRIGFTHQRSR
jgi:hypothetical protein